MYIYSQLHIDNSIKFILYFVHKRKHSLGFYRRLTTIDIHENVTAVVTGVLHVVAEGMPRHVKFWMQCDFKFTC